MRDAAAFRRGLSGCFGIGLALLVIGVMVRTIVANVEPTVTFPPPAALPSPNGFDFYLKATQQIAHEDQIKNLSTRPLAGAEAASLLAANANALKTLRKGLPMPYREPVLARGFDVAFPHYAKFRNLARLLALEGNGRREAGDIPGATQSYLDAVTMGNRIPRGGPIIPRLVGIACQAIGRRPIWHMVGHMNAPTAKAAARRIETLRKETWPYVETLTEEKYFDQAAFLQGFRDPAKFASTMASEGEPDNRAGAPVAAQAYFFLFSKRHIMNDLTAFMDRLIADASKPYADRTRPDPTPDELLTRILAPIPFQTRLKQVASEETQNALLNVALALRAYRIEHGTYPSDLGQLVPAYIAHVPNDPFAHSDPLIYRKEADDYVLYSVGPDGIDNAGRAIENPGDTESKRRAVTSGSNGDIVAGVNVY
jgi:hypothetical protein